jgi:hypothetical protein
VQDEYYGLVKDSIVILVQIGFAFSISFYILPVNINLMKKALLLVGFIFLIAVLHAQKTNPDTVSAGIYVTSIHDIDFKQKQYDIHFWIWFRYKKKDLDFSHNLEIPNAKSSEKLFETTDSSDSKNGIYTLMKYQCTINDSWVVDNFPFDHQILRIRFENSQYDQNSMVFKVEKNGEQYDVSSQKKGRLLHGWKIDSFVVAAYEKEYKTSFGIDTLAEPKQVYNALRVRINISRPVFGLFCKTFLGMYIAFLIAFVCFFIHTDGIDSRFSLSVGSLFAVIGNKYIIDSSLPETTHFSLVDTLHGITLFVIFIVVASTAIALRLIKKDKMKMAKRFDHIVAAVTALLYLCANIYFIYYASKAVHGT